MIEKLQKMCQKKANEYAVQAREMKPQYEDEIKRQGEFEGRSAAYCFVLEKIAEFEETP